MTEKPKGSFSKGVGQWIGAAEVYDAAGEFAGNGTDTRTVEADDGQGAVTVNVTFSGPFSLAGQYTISDQKTHRLYQGPLNYGYADALGEGLVAAHNYWPDHGLSQRFFLMVLPDGSRQLSLALLSRGESLRWTVVGEYQRQTDPASPEPPPVVPIDPIVVAGDPTAGRGAILLHRPGRWVGELVVLNGAGESVGSTRYAEMVSQDDNDDGVRVELSGIGPVADTSFSMSTDGWSAWTPPGDVVGSCSLSGGRGLSGSFLHHAEALRVWRREVVSQDGTLKGVVHIWYQGEERIGVVHGVLDFEPADG
ncbi:MAG: hypothetical protein ACR2PK_08065 [Acidimicrobiales bacterium]